MVQGRCVLAIAISGISLSLVGLLVTIVTNHQSNLNLLRLSALGVQHVFAILMFAKLFQRQTMDRFMLWVLILSSGLFIISVSTQIYGATRDQRFRSQPFVINLNTVFLLGVYIHFYFQILIYSGMLFVLSIIINIIRVCQEFRNRYQFEEAIQNLHSTQFDNSMIQKSENVANELHRNQDVACSICLVQFQKQRLYRLQCGHFFHKNCLKQWMKSKLNCPLCRTELL